MRIRPLAREDVALAARIVREGSLTPEAERPGDVEAYWAAVLETRRRRGEVLVADSAGQVVGVCQVMVFPHFQHTGGWCAELESVYVREGHRGGGVGAAMLAAAEDVARASGCYRIQLTSRNVRADAHRFYRAHGFEQTSQGFKKALGAGDLA